MMTCGHPESAVVQADEGTAYCGTCAAEPTQPLSVEELVERVRAEIEAIRPVALDGKQVDLILAELAALQARIEELEAQRDFHEESATQFCAEAARAEAECARLRGEIRRAQAAVALEMYAGARSETAKILRAALSEELRWA